MPVSNFFSDEEKKRITDAVRAAELDTSGEVRVHIEGRCKEDVLDCAAYWFEKLNMHKTALRNGVLFYMAVYDHKFAILGDAGINAKVPDDFWEEIKEHMLAKFKEGRMADGLAEGIRMAGEQLRAHFPYQDDDVNELPDDISFGEK
ncbi:TPM domain-containing protein [Gaoshiqia sp. Z1-71]|uniref:TPM domain-containing protein n=1 Tax=Gaoshiqia hydrogeniformans TaxID=3290090 RepID=UPI003BF89A8C